MCRSQGVCANSQLTLQVDHLLKASQGCGRGPLFGQIVIVSNRVAISDRIAKARAGGLESEITGGRYRVSASYCCESIRAAELDVTGAGACNDLS
jgi:hypothetical protein